MSSYTRREFAKLALTALPAAGLLSSVTSLRAAETPATAGGKPNSKVAGVQIGLNVPYSFSNPTMSGDDIMLRYDLAAAAAKNQSGSGIRFMAGNPGVQHVTVYRYR